MPHLIASYVRASFSLVFLGIAASTIATAAPAQGGRIHGRVLDPDGRPVAGATVILNGPIAAPRSVRSDAQGGFEVATDAVGRFRIRASAPGLAGPPVEVEVSEDATLTVDLPLQLTALEEQLVVTAAQVDHTILDRARQHHRADRRDPRYSSAVHHRAGAPVGARPDRTAKRRARLAHVVVPPRRRIGLHARAHRWHPGQRVRRGRGPLAGAARRRGPHRSGARPAERALRRRCHRRRRADHHAQRRGAIRSGPRRSRQPRDVARRGVHDRRSKGLALAGRWRSLPGRGLHR